MNAKLGSLLLTGALGASFLSGGVAEASGVANYGWNLAVVGQNPGAYEVVDAHDGEYDGNAVYANWYQGPGSGMYTLWNRKGYDTSTYYITSYWVTSFRICENNSGCSDWEYT